MEDFVIKTLILGQMQTNCYLVIDPKQKQAIIIDPGDEADFVIKKLTDEKVTPIQIIATHGHFDHIMAVWELQQVFHIPFLIHKKDLFLVSDLVKRARYYLPDVNPIVPKVDHFLSDNRVIRFAGHEILVIETPGHTPGSVCLYCAEQNTLFTGDTLFSEGGVGRTDFSYSSKQDLTKSLKKILKLPKKTLIYPGHGPLTFLAK